MKNSNNEVALVGLSQLSVNANVGMDEVVSIFISRFEDQQHSDRSFLQKEMAQVNSQIKALGETARTAAITAVTGSLGNTHDVGAFITYAISVDLKNSNLDWDKGQVSVRVSHKMVALVAADTYNKTSEGSVNVVVAIDANIVVEYQNLMARKAELTEQLTAVNNNLRDISRKERTVRAKLATMKLEEAGMSDLLNSPELLALVDGSVIDG